MGKHGSQQFFMGIHTWMPSEKRFKNRILQQIDVTSSKYTAIKTR